MKKIAIIGANEFQKRLVLKAREMCIETHVFAWEEGAVVREVADHFYPISIMEKDRILDVLKKIEVNGICSIASDLAILTVNYIAQQLDLVGNSHECTIWTTNKFQMREKLKESGMPVPKYQLIREMGDIDYEKFNYPVIVKPIDRSGSRGIYKVMNEQELESAITGAKAVSFTEDILVEEYIEGREFSVEAITQEGVHKILQITEKFTSGAPNFIEKAHISPARIEGKVKEYICEVIEKSLVVLELENGASHSEIKISPGGDIRIIEIASRMGGDFIGSDMVEISTGFDFLEGVIKVAIGENVQFSHPSSNKISVVKFIFDTEDIESFNKVKTDYPTIVKDFHVSSKIENVTDSSTRNGFCILQIENRKQLEEIISVLKIHI